jgi:hypothetical protein
MLFSYRLIRLKFLPRIFRQAIKHGLSLRRQNFDYFVVTFDRACLCSSTRRTNNTEELNVGFVIVSPLSWKIIFVVNSFHRTHWLTSTTVHTLIRVDIEHTVTFIDAVNRTLSYTSFVFDINTR